MSATKLRTRRARDERLIHLLQARHAFREGDLDGCDAAGPVQVVLDIPDVSCAACAAWYWSRPVERQIIFSVPR